MSAETPNQTPEDNDQPEDIADVGQDEPTLEADVQGFAEENDPAARIVELENELAEMKNKWMRAIADEQNIRRRSEKEKQDALKYGVTNFAREMVNVADNLGRAMSSVPEELKASDFVKGVEMTERELQNAFTKVGIKRIEALGKPFDHNLHQAVFEVEDPSQPAGLVAQVMQDGYVIHDRLLRPAMVGVSKGGPKYEPLASEDEASAAQAYENAGAESGEKLDQQT